MALSALTWTLLISLFAGFVICIVVIFGIVIPPEEHQLLLEIQNKIEKSHDYKQRISDYRKEYQYPLYELPLYSKDNYDFVHRLIHNVTGFKQNGTFIQSLIRTTDYKVSPSGYLTDNFQWKGVILEPEIQKLESFQEENAFRPSVQIIDACVAYTKESIGRRKRSPRGGGRGGRGGRGRMSGIGRYGSNRGWGAGNIAATQTGSRMFWFSNSLGGYTRSRHNKGLVSCYSIDVIFKALNATSCDLFMLGGYGKELYILKTIPFDLIKIDVILVQLSESIKYIIEAEEYGTYIENYLDQRSFRLMWKGSLNKVHTYIFKRELLKLDNI